MRIGFLGKGGSGKTTLAALFAYYIAQKQVVLVIDGDQNINLGPMLNMHSSLYLSDYTQNIQQYVHQNRDDLKGKPIIGTLPPTKQSQFIRVQAEDMLLKRYAKKQDNIILLQSGTYTQKDVGSTCYHGKLTSTEIIYHHLLDTTKDVVIGDATAGLDSLGNSMYMVHDLIVYVVEPTMKSVEVAQKFLAIAQQSNLNIIFVGNKIRKEQDVAYIEQTLPTLTTWFSLQEKIIDLEQGHADVLPILCEAYAQPLQKIEHILKATPKKWDDYYKKLVEAHITSATSWYDEYYGVKLSEMYDPNFSYTKVISHE